jgi:hypothetical protein
MIKIKSMCVALNFFCLGHFYPIPKISTPAKVIVAAIHSARATAAKLEIMDGFAFDDISTFFASDCVSDNSRHIHFLHKAFPHYHAGVNPGMYHSPYFIPLTILARRFFVCLLAV